MYNIYFCKVTGHYSRPSKPTKTNRFPKPKLHQFEHTMPIKFDVDDNTILSTTFISLKEKYPIQPKDTIVISKAEKIKLLGSTRIRG